MIEIYLTLLAFPLGGPPAGFTVGAQAGGAFGSRGSVAEAGAVAAAQELSERDGRLWEALESLEGGAAEERFLAARFLARHAEPGDGRLLLAGVRRGGPETRLRLVDALAGEDRHILIAAELLDPAEGLRSPLGTDILAGLIMRWNPDYGQPPLSRAQLVSLLTGPRVRQLQVLRLPLLGASIDALGRSGAIGVPLVLDPGLAEGVRRGGREQPPGVLRGTWDDVLDQLTQIDGATWEGFGFNPSQNQNEGAAPGDDGATPGLRPFIRVCLSGAQGGEPAVEHLLQWCSRFVGGGSLPARRAAARALAASGWPAAIHWLGARADGDPAARSGLVLAASRGRLSPWFLRSECVEKLLAEVDRELAAPDLGEGGYESTKRRAEELAAALAHLPAQAPHGFDQSGVGAAIVQQLLGPWGEFPARSLWLRLVALEGIRPVVPGLGQRIQDGAAAAANPPELRLQALRTLAALPGGTPQPFLLGRVDPLLECAGSVDALAALLVASGARWRDDGADLSTPPARACLLAWALGNGELATARALLAEGLADGLPTAGEMGLPDAWEPLLEVLERRSVALERKAVRRLLAEAFGAEERRRWPLVFARCALRTGCSSREEELQLLEADPAPREVGSMLCGQAHREARVHFIRALESARGADREVWMEAAEAGIGGLRARMQDAAVRRFLGELVEGLGEGEDALRAAIIDGDWPPRPPGGAVSVDSMTRWLW